MLPQLSSAAEPLAWPLPRALGSERCTGPAIRRVVVGPQMLEPRAVASWTEDDPDYLAPAEALLGCEDGRRRLVLGGQRRAPGSGSTLEQMKELVKSGAIRRQTRVWPPGAAADWPATAGDFLETAGDAAQGRK